MAPACPQWRLHLLLLLLSFLLSSGVAMAAEIADRAAANSSHSATWQVVAQQGGGVDLHVVKADGRRTAMEEEGAEGAKKYYCTDMPAQSASSVGFDWEDEKVKFVAVGRLIEQLTKARLHFAEVLMIANRTGRVLILPNVGNSQIGSSSDYKLLLCNYFSVNALEGYVHWVSEQYFLEHITPRRTKKLKNGGITKCAMFLTGNPNCRPEDIYRHARGHLTALSGRAKHDADPAIVDDSILFGPHFCVPCNGDSRLLITSAKQASKFDLLIVTKDAVRWCVRMSESYHSALRSLVYSEHLEALLENLKEARLGRQYLAVQWRTEQIFRRKTSERMMRECKRGLMKTVRFMMREHNLTGFFFASDLSPLNNGTSKSSSYNWRNMGHGDKLVQAIQSIHHTLRPVTWEMFDPNIKSVDPGIPAILDKLACVRAAVFLYAPHQCSGGRAGGRVTSSFVREIVTARREAGLAKSFSLAWNYG